MVGRVNFDVVRPEEAVYYAFVQKVGDEEGPAHFVVLVDVPALGRAETAETADHERVDKNEAELVHVIVRVAEIIVVG